MPTLSPTNRYALFALLVAAAPAARLIAEPGRGIVDAADHARTKVVILKTVRGNTYGAATGFLIRPGWVLTAGHAVAAGASVRAWVNGVAYRAEVADLHPEHDLALLHLQAPNLFLKPVELASASLTLADGEELVIVAGPSQGPSAHGDPAQRVLIPGHFRRRLQLLSADGKRDTMLSMEASVVPGDSGSPVVRVRDGTVVGILSSRQVPDETGVSHAAYAVPVEAIRAWIDRVPPAGGAPDDDFYLFRISPKKG